MVQRFINPKNILQITTDFFLFSFLLIILVVPILVSFNLDPQLYQEEENNVAGVTDTSISRNFYVEKDIITSSRVQVSNTKTTDIDYTATLNISGGEELNETIQMGIFHYQGKSPQKYTLRLISEYEDLAFITISAQGSDDNILYDGENTFEVTILAERNTSTPLLLNIISDIPIRYPLHLSYKLFEDSRP